MKTDYDIIGVLDEEKSERPMGTTAAKRERSNEYKKIKVDTFSRMKDEVVQSIHRRTKALLSMRTKTEEKGIMKKVHIHDIDPKSSF